MAITTGENIVAADFVANPAPYFSMEETLGLTHSLTTVANQKVLVMVKGSITGVTAPTTIAVQYDGVTQDSVVVRKADSGGVAAFSLIFTFIPGADTANITVTKTAGTFNSDVRIIVQKLLIG